MYAAITDVIGAHHDLIRCPHSCVSAMISARTCGCSVVYAGCIGRVVAMIELNMRLQRCAVPIIGLYIATVVT